MGADGAEGLELAGGRLGHDDLLVGSLVEVYADHGFGQGSPELLSLANQIMQRTLTPEQVLKVQEGIEEKKERRASALERFAASVEWWRHEV